jgi:hypothetical protein
MRKLVHILDVDPDLGQRLEGDELKLARRHLTARVRELERGDWDPHDEPGNEPGRIALLVIDGLMARRVQLANTTCAELLGAGDVLRPWQEDRGWAVIDFDARWRVLEPTRLAVLDRRFAAIAGRFPQVIEVLMARSVRRSRCLAFHMALSHLTGVEVRLLALFWYLADRWGRVTSEGITVPLPLTHQTLGWLVGARRPSVTTALGALVQQGRLSRRSGPGWVLHGEPPQALDWGGTALTRAGAPLSVA